MKKANSDLFINHGVLQMETVRLLLKEETLRHYFGSARQFHKCNMQPHLRMIEMVHFMLCAFLPPSKKFFKGIKEKRNLTLLPQ